MYGELRCCAKCTVKCTMKAWIRGESGAQAQIRLATVTAVRFAAEPENGLLQHRHPRITVRELLHCRCSLCISATLNFR